MVDVQELRRTAATRQPAEHTVALADGTNLFYRAWVPDKPTSKALLLFHRGHEHSGRWQETVESLGLDDVSIFAWDQRGHGRSPGERGSAPDVATLIHDADIWVRHLSRAHGIEIRDTIILAHSLGAVIAAGWAHDYGPPIRGLILATPAFRVKLYVPLALPLLRLRQAVLGPGFVKSYVRPSMITHDPDESQRYIADPLIFRQISVRTLLDLHDTSTRLLEDAGAVDVPLLVLAASSDWVVKTSAQKQFVDRVSSPVKEFEVLPGFLHAIFHEKDRALVIERVRKFIEDRFADPAPRPSLRNADQRGYTRDEYDRLCRPGGFRFAVARRLLRGPGRLSRGIDLGCTHGFDSGVMLDYIYENRARGATPLGRLIDRIYLNSIGWRGIRIRRTVLERILRMMIDHTAGAGRPVRILDIASGPGRYILETITALNGVEVSAMLRDYKEANVEAAAGLRDKLGLANVTVTRGDAFDRAALAAISPRPTIAIVSGLYELFPENDPVLRSLHGLADAVEPDGYLIYTNQPWHPQVEFIARSLTNREGRPWIMRRRTQAEMDELVRTAGFEKVYQEGDPWGIFTVSVARRARACC
jgi:alpha-beta hydrolase superfamily lysophospholipase/SAM-dependent methyltransferase